MPFWKLLDHNYVQSSFSRITRHIGNSVLKDTLLLKILQTWIKISANSFINSWVKTIKWKLTKVPLKLSLALDYDSALQRTSHQIDVVSLIVIRFFFSQTNLVFKSNPVFIDILDSFCHSLFTFSPFNYWHSTNFEVHSVPLRHFS